MSPLPELLLIGIPSIDDEHQALYSHLMSLIESPGESLDMSLFGESLSRLNAQLIDHFTNEEKLMRTLGLSDVELARHIDAHSEVIEQITQLSFDLMKRNRIGRDEVLAKVRAWVVEHLAEHDIQLRSHALSDSG